ncbi:hypothetical protein HNQ91_000957 [Filimonas zeae]|nr:hypothetical protein [Filimonas zeae]MDR6337935.1 hypothetical protein [Filimonas zeae]
MKNGLLYIALLAGGFAACNGNADNRVLNDSASTSRTDTANDSMSVCFQRYAGPLRQDTFTVHLVIREGRVNGELVEMPFEKDARRGTLAGTMKDSIITATWSYMQEGQQDTLPVVFKIKDGNLLQQPYVYDGKTGRETLKDTSAFSQEFVPFDCRKIPKQKS